MFERDEIVIALIDSCLRMISAQTLRVCREGKPLHTRFSGSCASGDWRSLERWPIVRSMRLKSSIWVAAYLRRCQTAGVFGAVRRRGAEEAGAVFVKVATMDGSAMLYVPAPQTVYDDSRPIERFFTPVSKDPMPEPAVEERLAREIRFDPDAWIVETEDKGGRHFLDLAKA
jgi:hypothetical protein